MSETRLTRSDIAEMPAPCALPRKSGEMVFHNEWERRAFALAVGLAEGGHLEWSEFQQQLITSIAESEHHDPRNPSRGYYESWLLSLEAVLRRKQLLNSDH